MENPAVFWTLIGWVVGVVAAQVVPRRHHDARAVALFGGLTGGLLGGWGFDAIGAPTLVELLGALLAAALPAGAVVVATQPTRDSHRR